MPESLTARLRYSISEGVFVLSGEIKPEGVCSLVEHFVRAQMGAGVDNSPANERDVYHLEIEWTPHEDVIRVSSDCGNRGLRDGILAHFLNCYHNRPDRVRVGQE